MNRKPARSVEKYIPLFNTQKDKIAIDYGAGNMRNSFFLHDKGYKVYAVDLPHKIKINSLPRLKCILPEELKMLNIKVSLTVCTFVLNLISQRERIEVFRDIAGKMKEGGFLLVETKGLTVFEIDMLIIPKGFIRIHNQRGRYTVICLYRFAG